MKTFALMTGTFFILLFGGFGNYDVANATDVRVGRFFSFSDGHDRVERVIIREEIQDGKTSRVIERFEEPRRRLFVRDRVIFDRRGNRIVVRDEFVVDDHGRTQRIRSRVIQRQRQRQRQRSRRPFLDIRIRGR